MGFALKAFAVGAANALSEKLDKDEKAAEESAKATASRLASKLSEREKETAERLKGYSNTIGALKAYHTGWTEQQLYNIARNPLVAEQTLSAFKDGRIDPATFDPQKYASLADVVPNEKEAMARITEEEKKQQLGAVPSVPQSSFFDTKDRATRIQQDRIAQYAKGLGVTPEQLYGADKAVPINEGDAGVKYDMRQVTKTQTSDQRIEDLRSKIIDANKVGDAATAKSLGADLQTEVELKSVSSPGQQQWANEVGSLKYKILNGTPEEKATANAKLNQVLAVEQREAQARHVNEPGGKIPALGTLQNYTSSAVTRKLQSKYGEQLGKDLVVVQRQGEGGAVIQDIDYKGDDAKLRTQINTDKLAFAKDALSLYTDVKGNPVNRDVASVIQSFVPEQPYVKPEAGAPASPAKPAPTPSAPASRPSNAPADARQAPDGNWYTPVLKDGKPTGKYNNWGK